MTPPTPLSQSTPISISFSLFVSYLYLRRSHYLRLKTDNLVIRLWRLSCVRISVCDKVVRFVRSRIKEATRSWNEPVFSIPRYRLNWWPTTLGGSASYFVFWSLALLVGFLLHTFDLDGLGSRRHHDSDGEGTWDWERKTTWVILAFGTMAMPALACFAKLRADRRQTYRRSLTAAQKTYVTFVFSIGTAFHINDCIKS